MTTTSKAPIHHVTMWRALEINPSLQAMYQQMYPGQGRAFGFTPDFSAKLSPEQYRSVWADGFSRALVELPGYGVTSTANNHGAHALWTERYTTVLEEIHFDLQRGVKGAGFESALDYARARDIALRSITTADILEGDLPFTKGDVRLAGLTDEANLAERTRVAEASLAKVAAQTDAELHFWYSSGDADYLARLHNTVPIEISGETLRASELAKRHSIFSVATPEGAVFSSFGARNTSGGAPLLQGAVDAVADGVRSSSSALTRAAENMDPALKALGVAGFGYDTIVLLATVFDAQKHGDGEAVNKALAGYAARESLGWSGAVLGSRLGVPGALAGGIGGVLLGDFIVDKVFESRVAEPVSVDERVRFKSSIPDVTIDGVVTYYPDPLLMDPESQARIRREAEQEYYSEKAIVDARNAEHRVANLRRATEELNIFVNSDPDTLAAASIGPPRNFLLAEDALDYDRRREVLQIQRSDDIAEVQRGIRLALALPTGFEGSPENPVNRALIDAASQNLEHGLRGLELIHELWGISSAVAAPARPTPADWDGLEPANLGEWGLSAKSYQDTSGNPILVVEGYDPLTRSFNTLMEQYYGDGGLRSRTVLNSDGGSSSTFFNPHDLGNAAFSDGDIAQALYGIDVGNSGTIKVAADASGRITELSVVQNGGSESADVYVTREINPADWWEGPRDSSRILPWDETVSDTSGAALQRTTQTAEGDRITSRAATGWKIEVTPAEKAAARAEAEKARQAALIAEAERQHQARILGADIQFGQSIGQAFGSSIGNAIAGDNVFARIGASTVLGATLGTIGAGFGRYASAASGGVSLEDAVLDSFDNFSANLGSAFQGAAVGAVSSFLVGELAETLGFDGTSFGDQLLRSAAGSVTSTVLNDATNQPGFPKASAEACHGEGLGWEREGNALALDAANDNTPATEFAHAA